MIKKIRLMIIAIIFGVSTNIIAQELSEDALKKANNPLAEMTALNFQNYYIPHFSEAHEQTYANYFWVRYAQPFAKGKLLMRVSVPFASTSFGVDSLGIPKSNSGLGDANVFLSYNFVSSADKTIGIGPLIAAPTASQAELGSGKWQVGVAFVAFIAKSSKFQFGSLITWQMSIAGDENMANTNMSAIQPFMFWQLGGGTYLRSVPTWIFDFEKEQYSVPFALGIGKVVKVNNTIFNLFIEPQYSILHKGTQPQFQIFAGINLQFAKK